MFFYIKIFYNKHFEFFFRKETVVIYLIEIYKEVIFYSTRISLIRVIIIFLKKKRNIYKLILSHGLKVTKPLYDIMDRKKKIKK